VGDTLQNLYFFNDGFLGKAESHQGWDVQKLMKESRFS